MSFDTDLHILGRQAGKTQWAIQWMQETQRTCLFACPVLIVHSEKEAQRLRSQEWAQDFNENQIISLNSALRGELRGRGNVVLCIDNLDYMLPQIFGSYVQVATMSKENVTVKRKAPK